jgi:DNA-binding HxlR family transcriptional regulator
MMMQKARRLEKPSRLAATSNGCSSGVGQVPEDRPKGKVRATSRKAHGRREVRLSIPFGELVSAIADDDRMEIVMALAHRPRCVGELQEWLGLPRMSTVTDHLQHLQEFGIVTWTRDKTRHIYRLTEHLKIFIEDGNIQIGLSVAAGHWLRLNIVEDASSGRIVNPPDYFLDASKLRLIDEGESGASNGTRNQSARKLRGSDPTREHFLGHPNGYRDRGQQTDHNPHAPSYWRRS